MDRSPEEGMQPGGIDPEIDIMSKPSRRAADREREAAAILGSKRVIRHSRFASAPDVRLVTLPDGIVLAPEVKTRAKLPKYLASALEQAKGYAPEGAEPLAIISAKGGRALAVLDARAFARIAGLNQPSDQGTSTS